MADDSPRVFRLAERAVRGCMDQKGSNRARHLQQRIGRIYRLLATVLARGVWTLGKHGLVDCVVSSLGRLACVCLACDRVSDRLAQE